MKKNIVLPRPGIEAKTLIAIGLPVSIAQSVGMMTGLIDTAMLGSYSTVSLAAAGAAITIRQYFLLIAAGASVGMQAAIAQSRGRNERSAVAAIAGVGCIVLLAASLIAFVALGFSQTHLLRFIGARGAVFDEAQVYLSITLFTLLPMFADAGFRGIATAHERTRLMLYAAIAMFTVKVSVNYALIYGNFGFPRLGIRGAAIAEVAASFTEFFVLAAGVFIINRRMPVIAFTLRRWRAHAASVFHLSSSTVIEWLLWSTGAFFITKFLLSYDPIHPALYNITMRIQGIFLIVASGFARAVLSLTARDFGAGNMAAVRRWFSASLRLSIGVMAVCAVVIIIAGPFALGLMADPAAAHKAVPVTLLFVLSGILIISRSVNIVTGSAIRSMGHALYFSIMMLIATILVAGSAFFLTEYFRFGVIGVLIAMTIDELSRNAVNIGYFRMVTAARKIPAASRTLQRISAYGKNMH
ncbi:MAG: MATE family efflux transporter [Spirochaetes bacterium]|nr:MATE family efflux transporter [Spirochaetota bacterium]